MFFLTEILAGLGEALSHHPLFMVGGLLLVGYYLGRLARCFRLPEISGFIVAGVLVNSFTTGLVTPRMNASLHVVTEVAIGFLALSIGGEFSARKVRRIGREVAIITAVHLLVTMVLVTFGCLLANWLLPSFEIGYPYAILLGVIACAVSPAIVVAEVHHLRAQGRFVDYLFGLVALGDAVTVLIFGLAFTVVTNILDPATSSSFLILQSLREIGLSVLVGLFSAVVLDRLTRRLKNPDEMLIVLIGLVFIVTGISLMLHFSPLLVNISMGFLLINLSSHNHRLLRAVEPLTPPIYALFFVLAGLELNPALLTRGSILAVGGFYVLLRAFSKQVGTEAGCRLAGLGGGVGRHLGHCTFAQGGIALGFVLLIQTSPALAALRVDEQIFTIFANLVNVVLLSIFVNEMISPFFLRAAVLKGNEMEG